MNAESDIVINFCTAKHGYLQKDVNSRWTQMSLYRFAKSFQGASFVFEGNVLQKNQKKNIIFHISYRFSSTPFRD